MKPWTPEEILTDEQIEATFVVYGNKSKEKRKAINNAILDTLVGKPITDDLWLILVELKLATADRIDGKPATLKKRGRFYLTSALRKAKVIWSMKKYRSLKGEKS